MNSKERERGKERKGRERGQLDDPINLRRRDGESGNP